MNKIFVIGFIGGFSSIIYCLMHKNKNINNIEIKYIYKIFLVDISNNIINVIITSPSLFLFDFLMYQIYYINLSY